MSAITSAPAAVLRNQARASCSRSACAPATAALAARGFVAARPVALSAARRGGACAMGASRVQTAVTAGSVAEALKVASSQKQYTNPTWGLFEMGMSPVYWEPATPKAGELMTIWFNPDFTELKDGQYVAFNGGFNGPFMCGGAPRSMAEKSRGEGKPLYSIRIQVPRYAVFLEFGFTDGKNWDEGYTLALESPKELAGKDFEVYNDGLSKEMSVDGACEAAIFPDPEHNPLVCMLPGGGGLAGQTCDLNIVVGCTDPAAANFDPEATHDAGSCELPE